MSTLHRPPTAATGGSRGATRAARARSTLRRLGVVALASLALTQAAHADPKDDARRHFRAGLEAAAEGDYKTAVDDFLAAYAAIPHAATAFNIARGYEDLKAWDDAEYWYRRFQEMDPSRAKDAEDALARVAASRPKPTTVTGTGVDMSIPPDLEAAVRRLRDIDRARAALLVQIEGMGVDIGPDEGRTTVRDEPIVAAPDPDAAPPPEVPDDASSEADVADATTDDGAPREALLTDAYSRVVVSASRYEQDPLRSPSSITVLSGDDVRATGAIHIGDALRRVVGVDVMSMSPASPYVGIRGFNSEMTNKVLWLIDGRPATLEFLASPFPFTMPIGLEEIERIEIIRGPGSALYGANAVTGVVNIITRTPGEGPAATAEVSAGWNRFVRGSATASGHMGPVRYRIGAGYQQEGRFEKAIASIPDDGPIGGFRRDQDLAEQRFRGNARFDTTFADKGFLSLSGGYAQGFTEYYSKAALGNFALDGGVGNLRFDLGYGPIRTRVYWWRESGRTVPWLFSTGSGRFPDAFVEDDVVDVEVEGNIDRSTGPVRHQLQIGAGYRYKQYRAGVFDEGFQVPRIEHHASLFAQYQLSWEWLQATASLRWDRHPLIEASQTISPRGALVFQVAKHTTIRTSAGTAFRAMNGLESYVNLELPTTADGYYVNFYGAATSPDPLTLQPERIVSAEIGARDESSRFHRLDVAVYYNRVTKLIDIGDVEPTLSGFVEESDGYNFGAASWVNSDVVYDSVGGEADLTFFPADGLDLFVNTSIQRIFATEPDGGSFVEGSTALARVNAGITYRSPVRLDVSLMAHYTSAQRWRTPSFDDRGGIAIGERDLPDRVLLVGQIMGRPLLKPNLELGVTVWNPLGFAESFREHPDGQKLGPRLFGTARVAF